jgi:hypothetical protein
MKEEEDDSYTIWEGRHDTGLFLCFHQAALPGSLCLSNCRLTQLLLLIAESSLP